MFDLNAGAGICVAVARISFRPVKAVIELGALADVIHTALNAVHHANRHAEDGDRIAVALPDLHTRRGVADPGQEIALFGSEKALDHCRMLDGVQRLVRRGMVEALQISEAFPESGAPGTAYLRDRAAAKHSPGAVRRALARAARRGKPMFQEIATHQTDRSLLALHYGDAVVHVRAFPAEMTNAPLLVSTYGFSSIGAPAVLPILPNLALSQTIDAA